MSSSHAIEDGQRIRLLVKRINDAWRMNRLDDLQECFHPDVIFLSPEFQPAARGREACIETYRQYLATAKTLEYSEDETAVEVWPDTAIATTAFDVTYEYQGQTYRETGHDTFAFTRTPQGWRAVWRVQIAKPKKG